MTKSLLSRGLLLLIIITIVKHSEVMAQNEYTIKVDLDAPREKVWEAITDFPSYGK